MAHDHKHGQAHSHGSSAPAGRAFAVGIGLNVIFVVVEVVYGLVAESIALVADAAHNLSDVLGLVLAWFALKLATRKPTGRRTYGYRKGTVLSALANALLLFVAVGAIAWEAVGRFAHPAPVEGGIVMIVAGIGVAINGLSALLFAKGSKHDINLRGAFLHLAADAAVSVGVVITGLVVVRTGWNWLDPAASILVSVVVLVGTWGLLKESLNLVLDAVPDRVDPDAVRTYLSQLQEVRGIHDLHIWAMSSTEAALTAHLEIPAAASGAAFLHRVSAELHERFGIEHVTIQTEEPEAAAACKSSPEGTL